MLLDVSVRMTARILVYIVELKQISPGGVVQLVKAGLILSTV